MKLIRTEWPKVRERTVKGNRYFTVDLRRAGNTGKKSRTFPDKEKALDFARALQAQVNKSGLDSIGSGPDPRLKVWTEQAAIYGMTLDQVVQFAFSTLATEQSKKASPFMAELITLWVDDKTTDKLKPLRPESQRAIRNYGNQFQKDFGMIKIKEVDRAMVENYLTKKEVNNRTRDNLRNYLHQFFNWCIKKNHLQNNPCKGIEITIAASGMPAYFSVEQCQNIMRAAMNEPAIVNYFALALFGGIRPYEIERMTWNNINFEHREITLPANITKTKTGRLFKINDTLYAWLIAYKNEKPLMPEQLRQKKEAVNKTLNGSWVQDGMRHTFATFRYAQHHSLEELRHEMGNSPSVINKFYRGTISERIVKGFWDITPQSLNPQAKTS